MPSFMSVEDLKVYQKLCDLHLEVCSLSDGWPRHERFELTGQVRRSSNSAPAQLAEKHDDRHIRNKIEGVNRARGEIGETIHHLYVASLKKYIEGRVYRSFKDRYRECIKMLNGMERTLERRLPLRERRWPHDEEGNTQRGTRS